ncbi:MAG: aldehyde dehydrogenase [Rhodospirillaceae bacterium]|nr:aldehyde dehydrogenase [Rhodospirillaceae bacterium]|tara:strand:- start:14009 stop:15433 length:1425 start_codon:yes stop_codon:yes gene_type:complete
MIEPILIGGKEVLGRGPTLFSQNPANGESKVKYSTASYLDLDDAINAATEANSSWREVLPHKRAVLLRNVGKLIERDKEELAKLQMIQNGKTIKECRSQAKACAEIFFYYASVCETQETVVTTPRSNNLSMTLNEPFGIVGLITPWNSPLTMEAQKLAPALAAGNSVILKPSEVTPGIGIALGKLCVEAGFPPELINVLNGSGTDVGSPIVSHPSVRMVSFTGGTNTGRAIARAASEKLMPVALELGGKSPHIVFADANIEQASRAIADGIFGSMGQSCVAGSRLLVQKDIYESLIHELINIVKSYSVGNPADESTELGPLSSFSHRDVVENYIRSAISDGGEILIGGNRPEGLDQGAYYLPTIIKDLSPNARAYKEEIFGPVLIVASFDNEEELIELANNSVYGLACGIWTNDFKRAWRIAKNIDAGTVWINSYKVLSIANPFGGMKDSGLGQEKGRQGIELYQAKKTISISI